MLDISKPSEAAQAVLPAPVVAAARQMQQNYRIRQVITEQEEATLIAKQEQADAMEEKSWTKAHRAAIVRAIDAKNTHSISDAALQGLLGVHGLGKGSSFVAQGRVKYGNSHCLSVR